MCVYIETYYFGKMLVPNAQPITDIANTNSHLLQKRTGVTVLHKKYINKKKTMLVFKTEITQEA